MKSKILFILCACLFIGAFSAHAFNGFKIGEMLEPQNFIIVLLHQDKPLEYKYLYPSLVGVFCSNEPLDVRAGPGYWPSELNQKYDFFPYTEIFMIKSFGKPDDYDKNMITPEKKPL